MVQYLLSQRLAFNKVLATVRPPPLHYALSNCYFFTQDIMGHLSHNNVKTCCNSID